jgi:hypothetical protein
MASFSQDVRNLTSLSCYDMDLILEQGIETAEDLAMFGDKDIDQLFRTPDLMSTPVMKQLKLKGLAEWLRDRSLEGRGFPIHEVVPADINEKLMDRARRGSPAASGSTVE